METQPTFENAFEVTRTHLRELCETLIANSAANRATADMAALKKIAVVSTPRVGSTLLCGALKSAGFGWAEEWFNDHLIEQYKLLKGGPLDFGAYIDDLILGSSNWEAGVFAVNIQMNQYLNWHDRSFDILSLGFEHVYWLSRRNRFAQAYSQAKSMKTGLWTRDLERRAGFEEKPKVEIKAADWTASLHSLTTNIDDFERLIGPKVTRRYVFEDLIKDQAHSAIKEISQDLGYDSADLGDVPPRTTRQSSDFDSEQLARLIAQFNGSV